MDPLSLIVIGMAFALNGILAFFNYLDKIRSSEEKNKLIKALISKNVVEYTGSEQSPREKIRIMEVENDLAKSAAKIIDDKRANEEAEIPIT